MGVSDPRGDEPRPTTSDAASVRSTSGVASIDHNASWLCMSNTSHARERERSVGGRATESESNRSSSAVALTEIEHRAPRTADVTRCEESEGDDHRGNEASTETWQAASIFQFTG
jgi:hypothetical protein